MTEPGSSRGWTVRLVALAFPLIVVVAIWAGAHVVASSSGGTVVLASARSHVVHAPTPASHSGVSRRGSGGASKVAVPDVAGYSAAQAGSLLAAVGLRLGTVTDRPTSTRRSGTVISSAPASGAEVGPGTRVDVVLSSGTASPPTATSVTTATMPDLSGLTVAQAEARLALAGVPAADVMVVRSPGRLDLLTKQSPHPGSRINPQLDKVILQAGDGS